MKRSKERSQPASTRARVAIAAVRVAAAAGLVGTFALLLRPATGRAQEARPSPPPEARTADEIRLPYGFYNELFGAAAAYLYSRRGFLQEGSELLATGMLVRLDVAGSPEGVGVQMMVDHPFQF
jgi:hypothetical protein